MSCWLWGGSLLPVIEDAGRAMAPVYRNRRAGACWAHSAIRFQTDHRRGGMFTSVDQLYERARSVQSRQGCTGSSIVLARMLRFQNKMSTRAALARLRG